MGTVSATPYAQVETITYRISDGDPDGKFEIDLTTGVLTAKEALGVDAAGIYPLTVEASTQDAQTATVTAVITAQP